MCFWMAGTFSGGTSTPRSPRATMMASATSRIESRCSTACGFSSLATIHASDFSATSRRFTWRTSSAVRTNETATASTPSLMAKIRSSSSFSVRDGTLTGIPGRLMPLFSPSMPPLMISQTTSTPLRRSTRSSIRPSERRMREPRSRFSASVLKVVPTIAAEPAISRGVMVRRSPATSCTGLWSFNLPVRIFGPCRSARIQMGLRSAAATARTIRMSSPFCAWLPWEKFRRATSTPARTSLRKISGVLHEGPRVATILARRVRGIPAKSSSVPKPWAALELFALSGVSIGAVGSLYFDCWLLGAGRFGRGLTMVVVPGFILPASRGICLMAAQKQRVILEVVSTVWDGGIRTKNAVGWAECLGLASKQQVLRCAQDDNFHINRSARFIWRSIRPSFDCRRAGVWIRAVAKQRHARRTGGRSAR